MIDFEKLLKPIRDDAPAGEDLRYRDGDLTFQTIEEFRVDEDPALIIEGEPKTANWPKVVRTCEEALANKTKDLELAAFLMEGLAHTQGFEGVRDGLRLQKELLQTFWDVLHPGVDEGEVVLPVRAKPLNWLALPNGFLRAVKAVGFVNGAERSLSVTDLEMSERVDATQLSDQDAYQELLNDGNVTGEAWRMALNNTPIDQLESSYEAVKQCSTELSELSQLCDERFGDEDSPRLMALSDLFDEVAEKIEPLVRPPESDEESGEASGGEVVLEAGGAAAAPRSASGPIASRQDALKTLGLVADYFRRTEPHTPITYLVQRAVRWGNMPFEDLLREVVKSDDALKHIWETLGINESEKD